MSVDLTGGRGRSMSMTGRSMSIVPTEAATKSETGQPSNRVVINVGGVRFETFKSTLKNIPDTRLSWITESTAHNVDYDPGTKEYFFDRHPDVFLMILNYYRTGKLHAPSDVCGPMFEEELAFWGIDEKQIEPCCWMNYRQHRDAQETLQELEDEDQIRFDEPDSDEDIEFTSKTAKLFGIVQDDSIHKTPWEKWRPKVWSLLDDPYSSKAALVLTIISLTFVLVSIAGFVMETHIYFRVDKITKEKLNDSTLVNMTNADIRDSTEPHQVFMIVEITCLVYFTIEFIARIIFCPKKKSFMTEQMTWVDIISISPVYIQYIVIAINATLENDPAIQVISAFRLIRIFRIFKMTKHFNGLKILYHAIKASAKELLLLIYLLCLGVLIFAVLIYYAELVDEDEKNSFVNIPIGFWWAVVTMTTLGYGEKVPKTGLGYIVGSLCAVCGVLLIALPVPVIVNNFQLYYSHAQAKAKLPKKRRHILVGAADALKTQIAMPGEEEDDDAESQFPVCDSTGTSDKTRSSSISPSVDSCSSLDRKGSNDTIDTIDSGIKTGGSNASNDSSGISVIFTDEVAEASPPLVHEKMHLPSKSMQTLTQRSKGPQRRMSFMPSNMESNKVYPSDPSPLTKRDSLKRNSLLKRDSLKATPNTRGGPPRRRSLMPPAVVEMSPE